MLLNVKSWQGASFEHSRAISKVILRPGNELGVASDVPLMLLKCISEKVKVEVSQYCVTFVLR
jgi:hypothetical protein